MDSSNPFLGINRSPLFLKFLRRLVMNTRILNRESAWKVAGRLGIVIKNGKEMIVRGVKINTKMNKRERNLMENFGAKN